MELVVPAAILAHADRDQLAAELGLLFGRDLADQPPIILQQARAMAKHDTSGRLSELAAIPTLVVSAAQDRIALPQYGRALAQAIPGARYVELPDAAHGVPIQNPASINNLLVQHFAASEPVPPA